MNTQFTPLSRAVLGLVQRMTPNADPSADPVVATLCALCIEVIDRGSDCLPLDTVAGRSLADIRAEEAERSEDTTTADGASPDAAGNFTFPALDGLLAALRAASDVVASVDDWAAAGDIRPFVLSGPLLFTRRNYEYERSVREWVLGKTAQVPDTDGTSDFPGLEQEQTNAANVLIARPFAILTGGPGTGKTHTLARAVTQAMRTHPDLRFTLAAPTGKAAARMVESIQAFRGSHQTAHPEDAALLERLPTTALTIHKLLGANLATGGYKYNRLNPLPVDWLVVDEGSMVDLLLFAHLLDALPPDARLTLIGDANQLASVERGRIFRDLCELVGESGAVARLDKSRRFKDGTPIDRFARAVNAGDVDSVERQLRAGSEDYLVWHKFGEDSHDEASQWDGFLETVRKGFSAFAAAKTPEEALAHINDFRVLCAMRHHPKFGSEALHELIRKALPKGAPVPVMVTKNDRSLEVNNGDLGVVMPDQPDTVYLETPEGKPRRSVNKALLPNLEGAFATTVHKSQGSEYADVAVVLASSGGSPLLTREILYTAVTRTRATPDRGVPPVSLWSSESALRTSTEQATIRSTGLVRTC